MATYFPNQQRNTKVQKKPHSQPPMVKKTREMCLCKWWRNPKMFHLANVPKRKAQKPFLLVYFLAGGLLAFVLPHGDYTSSF